MRRFLVETLQKFLSTILSIDKSRALLTRHAHARHAIIRLCLLLVYWLGVGMMVGLMLLHNFDVCTYTNNAPNRLQETFLLKVVWE